MNIKLRLNPDELERFLEIANRECRRPDQQARFMVLTALGLRHEETKNPVVATLPETTTTGFEKTTT